MSGGFAFDTAGGLRFTGGAADLFASLDASIERLAVAAGATPFAPAPAISGAILERAGYFEAFPDFAVPAASGAFVPPAACYQVYAALAGAELQAPRRFTLAVRCGRREQRSATEAGRLQQFLMREIVFVGDPAWVAAERDGWIARAQELAASMALSGTIEAATDTFFGAPGRGRRLLQQLKQLKFELRMDAGRFGTLAVASFNLHETFFGSRFDIRLADGSPASSGCAAFGIERWTLARLEKGDTQLNAKC
jgi:seryl-tRNA synthetase